MGSARGKRRVLRGSDRLAASTPAIAIPRGRGHGWGAHDQNCVMRLPFGRLDRLPARVRVGPDADPTVQASESSHGKILARDEAADRAGLVVDSGPSAGNLGLGDLLPDPGMHAGPGIGLLLLRRHLHDARLRGHGPGRTVAHAGSGGGTGGNPHVRIVHRRLLRGGQPVPGRRLLRRSGARTGSRERGVGSGRPASRLLSKSGLPFSL